MKEKIKVQEIERLNLVPILDAVFIFIFFLLLSTDFNHLGELSMDFDKSKNKKAEKKVFEVNSLG